MKGNLYIQLALIFFSFHSSFTKAEVLFEQTDRSVEFLVDDVINLEEQHLINTEAAENAIEVVSRYLNVYKLSLEDEQYYRTIRAMSLMSINFKRLHANKTVDIEQANQAITDIDFIVKNTPSADLTYSAGHIAMHLLQHPASAYEYWEKCAFNGHAGCMNIMATHRFTGENGLPIDVQKSVYWHKRVYETGTDYQCAGVLSAHDLSKMAFLFPSIDTGNTWEIWLQKRNELVEKVAFQSESTDHCSMAGYYFNDYVLHGTKVLGKSPLNDAIELAKDVNQKMIFEAVKNHSNLDKMITYLEKIEAETDQCDTALSVLFYAKTNSQVDAFNSLENYILDLSPEFCATEQMIIQRLQNDGRWQPNGKFESLLQPAF